MGLLLAGASAGAVDVTERVDSRRARRDVVGAGAGAGVGAGVDVGAAVDAGRLSPEFCDREVDNIRLKETSYSVARSTVGG